MSECLYKQPLLPEIKRSRLGSFKRLVRMPPRQPLSAGSSQRRKRRLRYSDVLPLHHLWCFDVGTLWSSYNFLMFVIFSPVAILMLECKKNSKKIHHFCKVNKATSFFVVSHLATVFSWLKPLKRRAYCVLDFLCQKYDLMSSIWKKHLTRIRGKGR